MRRIFFVLTLLLVPYVNLGADAAVDKLKKRISLMQLQGWCSAEKTQNLLDLVLEVKPQVYVEIGVFGGASLIPVACGLKFLKRGAAIGIDPWSNAECIAYLDPTEDKEHIDWWIKENLILHYERFLDMLTLYELEDYCTIFEKTSKEAASSIENIDVLHIDGHRSEQVTMQDAELYLPKVVPGGYIWVNDVLSFNKQKALNFILESCDIVKVIDDGNCVLFRKR